MLIEKPYKIEGNEPLLLNKNKIVWRVISGQISIFATFIDRSRPIGNRRYLFDVNPGEALFSIDPQSLSNLPDEENLKEPISRHSFSLLAVPLETAQLEQFSLRYLVTKIAEKDKEASMGY